MLTLIEKLPTWFKTKWSEKVMRLQNVKGKDTFPSFREFVDEVCYHAQRINIPQLIQITATPRVQEDTRNHQTTKQMDSKTVFAVGSYDTSFEFCKINSLSQHTASTTTRTATLLTTVKC